MTNSIKQITNNRGFTLIETLVALAVITTGLVIVLQVFPAGFSVERNSQLETQAVLSAQGKIEALLARSFSELYIGTETETIVLGSNARFIRATKISFIDANLQESTSPTTFKKIETTVSWSSPLRIGSHEVKLITLFAEK